MSARGAGARTADAGAGAGARTAGAGRRRAGRAERLLVRCVLAALAVEAAAIAAGVAFEWPAQFGGGRDADAVRSEWLTHGTAVSAPVFPLAAFALGALLVRAGRADGAERTGLARRARLARLARLAGVALVAVAAAALAIGSLGEALAPATPDVPRAVLVASGVVGCALAAALFAACVNVVRPRGITDDKEVGPCREQAT